MEVKGFPNYLVYPDGNIFSKARRGTPARILKQCDNGRGYLMIRLTNNQGKRITKYPHRLVAEHYIPNPENKREVDHINRNSHDNNINNLRWVTPKENSKNTGCFKSNQVGFKYIGKTKLTPVDSFSSIKKLINHSVATKLFAVKELQNHLSFCHKTSTLVKSYQLNYQHSSDSLKQLYNLLYELV
jgi:hypothetical protein